ncbi:MAG: LCP family protein [Candidatus Doudnabacteria bacterium]|jgi:LCP family protein required for cell wall assembly
MNEFTPNSKSPHTSGKNFDSINLKPRANTPPKITVSASPLLPAKPHNPPTELNFLTAKSKHGKKSFFKKILVIFGLVILVLLGAVTLRAANLSDKIFVGTKTTFFEKVRDFIRGGGDNAKLVGEDLGQINILLLGIGGEGHDGPYLSDTMILAEIRPDLGQVSLVSIPRDYLTTLPQNFGDRKINAAFAEGYNLHKDWNEGGKWAREAVEKLSGQKVPYFAVIDFAGFEKAIDQVGGVDVQIDRTFTDYSYPDSNLGYLAPITFTQGQEHMDSVRALQFARSRHAAGPEGSDFSRSTRQQKIISALKAKVLSLNLISNAGTINSLLDTFANHFHTNITPGEIFHLLNLIKEHQVNSFISLSLDPSTSLVCPKIMEETGAYVLIPCEGKDETDIKNFFKNVFSLGKMLEEKSVVWLSTSSGDRANYQKADQKLKEVGLTVWELAYKGEPLAKNIFYQVNPKSATAEFIKTNLSATEVTLPPPAANINKDKVDVIVILGANNN